MAPSLAAALVMVAACSGGDGESDAAEGTNGADVQPAADSADRWLEVRVVGDLPSYDPYQRTTDIVPMVRNMYEPLVDYDAEGNVVPLLAESYTVADDHASFVVQLRDGVTFHNGETLTAEHVVANFEAVADPAVGGLLAGVMQDVDAVEAVDERTVEFTLAGPRAEQLMTDILQFVPIGYPDNYDDVANSGVGTGPFRQGERQVGRSYSLERYADYWGEPARVAGINYQVIQDGDAAASALQTGEIHAADRLPEASIATLEEAAQLVDLQLDASSLVAFSSPKVEPFDRDDVRQALTLAIDRDAIVQAAYFGYSEAKVLPWSEGHPAYDPGLAEEHSADLDAARDAFAAAGVTSLPEPIYVLDAVPATVTAGEIIQESLSGIGVSTDVEVIDINEWLERFNSGDFGILLGTMAWTNKHPLVLTRFATVRTADNPLFPDGTPPDYYLQAVADAQAATSDEEQAQAYDTLNQAMMRLATTIFIAASPNPMFTVTGVQDVVRDVDSRPLFGSAYFTE